MAAPVTPLTRDQVQLVEEHLKLVGHIVKSFKTEARKRRVNYAELVSEGNWGLVNAAQTWSDALAGRIVFATHAGKWIRGLIGRLLKKTPLDTLSDFSQIADRRPRAPGLEPLFPLTTYDPRSTCPHRVPIEDGSIFVCMICHQSGQDDHPALQRDPRTDPQPEPKPKAYVAPKKSKRRETRKERRKREYAPSPTAA